MPSAPDASRRRAHAARSILACALLLVAASTLRAGDPRADDAAHQPADGAVGATIVVRAPENAPAEKVSLRAVITRGASADPIGASGAAHVLSHALWDGAMDRLEARAEAGDADAAGLLRAMGGRRHAHRAAPVDMFSMAFTLDLSDADESSFDEALSLLSDIVSLDDLTDDALTRARETVEKELRGWSSPYLRINQRATRAIFEPLGVQPGPFVGRREEVATLQAADLRTLAESLFVRGGATLIVVGADADAESVGRSFTPTLSDPAPFCPMVASPPAPPSRSIVVRDEEATSGVVELLRVERGRFDQETVLRRDAAARALARRVEIAASTMTGDAALGELVVISKPFAPGAAGADGVWLNLAHAMNAPGEWEHALRVLAGEVRRVELHGYTERERALAVLRALEPFREDARRERAGEPRDIADRLMRAVAMGEPPTSAADALRDAETALAELTAEDLRNATIRAFAGAGEYPRRGLVSLVATGAEREVAIDSVERVVRGALAAEMPALDASAEPAMLDQLRSRPSDGRGVAEVRIDPDSGVLTMTLANGLLVHHRAMGEPGGEVIFEATVGGGEIDELAGVPRGITEAAISAWNEPATARLSSLALADALAGTGVEVRAYAEQDTVRLRVRGADEHAEAAGLVLAALLSEPRVEPAALERWKQSALERDAAAATQPFDRLRRSLWALVEGGNDPRVRFPDAESVRTIDAPAAQRWLDNLLARGDVEIAIVGAITREDAARCAEALLSRVPQRPGVGVSGDRHEPPTRKSTRVDGLDEVESLSEHTAALVGVLVDGDGGAAQWAAGEIASRALTPLTRDALAGETTIANEPRTLWLPMDGWRGFSLLYTPMVAPVDDAERTIDAAWGVYERLAREGLTPAEMEEARESVRRTLASSMEEPDAWARALSDAHRRGRGVATLLDRRAAVLRVSAEDVRSLVASAMERGSVRTVVAPRKPEDRPGPAE